MESINRYSRKDLTNTPNFFWGDITAAIILFACIISLGWGAKQMFAPFSIQHGSNITLDIVNLPVYALKSVLRMFIALIFSLLFTFIFGTLAAKSDKAEKIIIPLIDLLQSIPVLGFLSITVWGFIALFPGKLLGPECAAIFAIFTSQAWNIALSFYQSLKTLPKNIDEAVKSMHLNAWQRFWHFEVPFAMPGIIWNTMLSLSAGWFFVVASEAFSIANTKIKLPGIGSYIALAVEQSNSEAINYAIFTMFIVILLYNELIIKPLLFWANKFNIHSIEDNPSRPWIVKLFTKTWVFKKMIRICNYFALWWINLGKSNNYNLQQERHIIAVPNKFIKALYYLTVALLIYIGLKYLANIDIPEITFNDIILTIKLGFATTLRIFICTTIATCIWLPIGVWIGFRPNLASTLQPIIQFLAAFPANLLFPAVVVLIIKYQLNINIWTSPLIILGTQWYILFNVIAGIQALPKSIYYAVNSMQLPKLIWWQKVILPGISTHLITGIITAVGGAWNASIVAEYVEWGDQQLIATGLGGYIASCYRNGDFVHLSLGVIIMCIFVLIINRFIWLPLCHLAQERSQ